MIPGVEVDNITSESVGVSFSNSDASEGTMTVTWNLRQGTIDGTIVDSGSQGSVSAIASFSILNLTAETTY